MLLHRQQAEAQVSTLTADLRRSVGDGELLKQRNDELADELGRLRYVYHIHCTNAGR